MTLSVAQGLEKWSAVALEQRWADRWVEGAIYPREMIFFLAACEHRGVRLIVESGRQDGYSTEIIGFYAREHGGVAYSIDYEADEPRARRCRERLAGNPALKMVKGDGVRCLGPLLLDHAPTPAAVLLDGPKGWLALSAMLAAARVPGVAVMAMHNVGYQVMPELVRSLGPGPHFHEDLPVAPGSRWEALKQAETTRATAVQAVRSLEQSTLGVLWADQLPASGAAVRVPLGWLSRPGAIRARWRIERFLAGPARA